MRANLILAALCVATALSPLAAHAAAPDSGQQVAQADPNGPPPSGPPPGYAGWGSYGQQAGGQPPAPPAASGPPPQYAAPQGGPAGQGGQQHPHGRERFEMANTTHDGRLTYQQAQAAGWHGIVRHFGEIDRDRKGYVTWQDIREYTHAMHQAKMQRQQNGGPPPGAGAPPPGADQAPPPDESHY